MKLRRIFSRTGKLLHGYLLYGITSGIHIRTAMEMWLNMLQHISGDHSACSLEDMVESSEGTEWLVHQWM